MCLSCTPILTDFYLMDKAHFPICSGCSETQTLTTRKSITRPQVPSSLFGQDEPVIEDEVSVEKSEKVCTFNIK